MRNPLLKRIPRDFRKNIFKYLGMIIILVCTISIGSSFQATMKGATAYLDNIKDGNNQEDGFIESSTPLSGEVLSHLEDEGLWVEENFYATEREFTDSTKILLFDERKNMDIPTLFEGKMPEQDDEIVLDHVFARNREFGIGDTITLLGKDYTICGTVSLPDYSALFMNNSDLMMNTNHFCVSVLSSSGFDSIDDASITYRYSYRHNDRNLTEKERTQKAEDIYKYLMTNGMTSVNILTREQNQSIYFLEMDLGTDGPFMTVFVYMLVAMIAFIFAILTNNTIERESVIIGTLRSLGFSKREIIWHYLQPTLIVAVIGSVLGNVIGYTAMIRPFIDIYYTTYSVGPIEVQFDVKAFMITTILPIVIMVLINTFMLAKKLSLSPLKFLRRELKKGKDRRTIKLPDFSFMNRFRLRVIIQNKGSYIMLFLGIFLASFLLMFGIGLDPLMNHYTENIDKSLPYNYQYILKAPVDTDDGEKLMVYEMDTWFSLGKKDVGISCLGITDDSHYFKDAYVSEGIAISSALSGKFNLDVGDTLKLTDKSTDKEYTFDIKKVFRYDAAMSIFIDRDALLNLLDMKDITYNSILSDNKLDIPESCVAKVISREDLLGASNQMMDSFANVILYINIFSVIVYMVILYIMTKVVIEKNAIPISYMKVFGYKSGEIRKLYLTATTIVVLASLVLCIPIEAWLFKLVLVFLSSMIDGYISFYLPARVYIEIIVIGIVAYLCINALHIFSVKKIPMSDALKNRE